MPTGIYTYQNLLDDAKRDAGSITNILRLANRAARFVVSDIDLRSTKRMAYASPSLNENQFDYQAPADLKELALVDVRRIEGRTVSDKFNLTTTEYFDRNKGNNGNLLCIEDRDWLKKVRISAALREDNNREVVISQADTTTIAGGTIGTWTVSVDASNLTVDKDNFLYGSAALNFDMDQAGSTTLAGYIQNSTFKAIDLSDFEHSGSVYVSVYIPLATPSTLGLTGFTLRIGSSSTVYFSRSVTKTNENLAFYEGWNLLRFDFSAATETGTVDMDNIDYIRLAVDKSDTGNIASTDWRVDYVVARRGKPHEIWYYTKYAWQSSAGTYLENSTAATDLLNVDTEEYELVILKLKEIIAMDREEFDAAANYSKLYEIKKASYEMRYPSERLKIIQTYYNYGSNVQESWLNN